MFRTIRKQIVGHFHPNFYKTLPYLDLDVGSHLYTLLDNCLTFKQLKQIHTQILVNGLHDLRPVLAEKLTLSTRNFCPTDIQYVQRSLLQLPNSDPHSWSSPVRSLVQRGLFKEAITFYVYMQRSGVGLNTFAVSSALRACARISHRPGGISIHGQVQKYEIANSVYVQTALLDFYSKVGDLVTARKVFDLIDEKNVVSWNSLLAGYLKYGDLVSAEELFDEIPMKDTISWNSMVSGYARSGDIEKAYLLFQQIPDKNVASWNTVISGYVDCGRIEIARSMFDSMREKNSVSWITMISGYSKLGDVKSAEKLFTSMLKKDDLAFNAMIACYAQNGRAENAIRMFKEMCSSNSNIKPGKMTLASVISAASQLGDSGFGDWVESYIRKHGIQIDDHMMTAFIDLYAKCGMIEKAHELFNLLGRQDLVAYTAMIVGCGLNGKVRDAIALFEEMVSSQIQPNLVTFSGILTAYSHAGLVEEGYRCFTSMQKYGLTPTADHYGIMVDLLGRAGRINEAYELIKVMPIDPNSGVWGALLLACRLHNNIEIGEVAAQQCLELEGDGTGYCSLLANIYAGKEKWDESKRLRRSVNNRELAKIPGCSWVESGSLDSGGELGFKPKGWSSSS